MQLIFAILIKTIIRHNQGLVFQLLKRQNAPQQLNKTKENSKKNKKHHRLIKQEQHKTKSTRKESDKYTD